MIRIGLTIDGEMVPTWVNEVIREIGELHHVQWGVVIQVMNKKSNESSLFRAFKKIDNILLPGKPNLAKLSKLKISDEVPVLKVHSELTSEELNKIAESKPDLFLHLSSQNLSEKILSPPRFGVWSLEFGRNADNRAAGFWEWFYQSTVSEVALVLQKQEASKSECLARSIVKTEGLSLSRNQTAVFSKAIDLIVNAVSKSSESKKYNDVSDEIHIRKVKRPNPLHCLIAIQKLFFRAIQKILSKIFFLEQWILFYSLENQKYPELNFKKFKEMIPPKDRIWADPFVVSQNDKHYLFIEELLTKTNKGHITCMVLDEQGEIETSQIIIDKPYHLSYPFLFQHQNVWYMIPESGENHTVDLFECTEFPFQWKFKKSLLKDIDAYDSTLHFHDQKFWLFCTIKKRAGASTDDDLYLFYSDDFLIDDWKPHPKNPVLSDPSVARPAGRIFNHQNTIYRPSQIGVPRYGYGLSLNKITMLTGTDYKEEIVNKALPDWRKDLVSLHTLNFSESITFIDGQLKRFKF